MITFVVMKRKYPIGSFLFGLAVFFAILLQSAHSFHHLEETISAKKCHHDYSKNTTQITHSHHFDHCFVCEFTFSNSVEINHGFAIIESNSSFYKPTFFTTSKDILFFTGSSFSLRGPPKYCSLT